MGHGHTWCCCGHGSCWPALDLEKSWWPEHPGSKESEMSESRFFLSQAIYLCTFEPFSTLRSTQALRFWVTWMDPNVTREMMSFNSLAVRSSGPRQRTCLFWKGTNFTHLNSFASKISVRGWPQAFHISYPLSCQTDCKCPQGRLWLLLCPWQSRPPQEVQRSSQKPLGLRDCSRSFLTCVT